MLALLKLNHRVVVTDQHFDGKFSSSHSLTCGVTVCGIPTTTYMCKIYKSRKIVVAYFTEKQNKQRNFTQCNHHHHQHRGIYLLLVPMYV